MNLSDLAYLLEGYGADKLLLAIISLALSLLLKKLVLKGKFRRLACMAPFIIGILLSLILCVVKGQSSFSEVIKSGSGIGSAATVIYTFAINLIGGEGYENVPVDALVIEGMLAGYVKEKDLPLAAEAVAQTLRLQSPNEPDEAVLNVKNALISVIPGLTETEAELMAKTAVNVFISAK